MRINGMVKKMIFGSMDANSSSTYCINDKLMKLFLSFNLNGANGPIPTNGNPYLIRDWICNRLNINFFAGFHFNLALYLCLSFPMMIYLLD